jgi:hypothetical protein
LVYTSVLGTDAARRGGSSPLLGTNFITASAVLNLGLGSKQVRSCLREDLKVRSMFCEHAKPRGAAGELFERR